MYYPQPGSKTNLGRVLFSNAGDCSLVSFQHVLRTLHRSQLVNIQLPWEMETITVQLAYGHQADQSVCCMQPLTIHSAGSDSVAVSENGNRAQRRWRGDHHHFPAGTDTDTPGLVLS